MRLCHDIITPPVGRGKNPWLGHSCTLSAFFQSCCRFLLLQIVVCFSGACTLIANYASVCAYRRHVGVAIGLLLFTYFPLCFPRRMLRHVSEGSVGGRYLLSTRIFGIFFAACTLGACRRLVTFLGVTAESRQRQLGS